MNSGFWNLKYVHSQTAAETLPVLTFTLRVLLVGPLRVRSSSITFQHNSQNPIRKIYGWFVTKDIDR